MGCIAWLGAPVKYLWGEQAENQNSRKKTDAEFSPSSHLPPNGLVLGINRPSQHPAPANRKAIHSCKNDRDYGNCDFDVQLLFRESRQILAKGNRYSNGLNDREARNDICETPQLLADVFGFHDVCSAI
jgi:hypothetical protein